MAALIQCSVWRSPQSIDCWRRVFSTDCLDSLLFAVSGNTFARIAHKFLAILPRRIEDDVHIKKVAQRPIQYRPAVYSESDLQQTGIMTLRGPRQIGKTTYLKFLIRDLLKEGISAGNIFFYNAELVADERELFEIIRQFIDFSQIGNKYIFLDEITLVPRWEYALKHAMDTGMGEETLFILSGSSAMDLRRGSERLPGRRQIANPDRVLLPLSFRRFCELQHFIKSEVLYLANWQESLNELLPHLKPFYPRLQSLFERYLMHGGFPIAIADYEMSGRLSQETLETYRTVVISDFEKLRKDRITLRNICRKILMDLSSPVSWNRVAKAAGAIAVNTAKEYILMLADAYLLFILEFLDRGHSRPRPNKNRKLYPFEPIIYHVFGQIANMQIDLRAMPNLIEGTIGAALLRAVETNLFEGFSSLTSTFYWRSSRDKEVDFVVMWDDREVPIEIKYQSHISASDYTTIKRSFGSGIVITKDHFFQDGDIYGIPAACFLHILPD